MPVFSYARTMITAPFIPHLLLSLGHFVTEVTLLLHATIRELLQKAKLVGPSNNPGLL